MCKYFLASDDLAIETTREMDPFHKLAPGAGLKAGRMRAHLSVYEPGDPPPHPSLPTLREFIEKNTDPATGLLTYDITGERLSIDPKPLLDLPREYLDYRVSPGCSFVTNEALERARARAEPA